MSKRLKWFWAGLIVLLAGVTAVAAGIAWFERVPGRAVHISLAPSPGWSGSIYVTGNVTMPGLYPFANSDTLAGLMAAAGAAPNASGSLQLYVPTPSQSPGAQKVDINHADPWLLQALPGIGLTLADRIVDYRQKNGPFKTTAGLMDVPGIGAASYDRIKDLVTVAE